MGLVYDADRAIYKFGLLASSNAHNVTWHQYPDSQVTDAAVCALGSNCPRLKSVNLSSCVQITDAGIIAIARRCPLLVDIDCGHCGLSPCLASCGNGMKGCPRPVWGCSKATSSSLRPRLKNCNRYNNEVNNRVDIFEIGFLSSCVLQAPFSLRPRSLRLRKDVVVSVVCALPSAWASPTTP